MHLSARGERGQAAVEAALTLPLTVFLILGTLQLFLMLQARLMVEHAAYRATRAGAVSQGSCKRMLDAAITLVLPTFAQTSDQTSLAQAYQDHAKNRFKPEKDGGHSGTMVWLNREKPDPASFGGAEYEAFDDPDSPLSRLEVRMVFWYPMRIPFANWVIASMVRAAWGTGFTGTNALLMTRKANWTDGAVPAWLDSQVKAAFDDRFNSPAGTYVFPIQATAAMRMMTPPRQDFFASPDCGTWGQR